MTDRDERVREIAYFLWLDAGSPEGEAERHWLAAEGLVEPEPVEEERIKRGASDGPKKAIPVDDRDGGAGLNSNRL
jgi:Protein of unknown function (DUF2934)